MRVILHHTVTGHNVSISTIKNWRYNFVIRWNGSIIKARGGGHTWGHNDWTGISLIGNFEKEQPNQRQLNTLIKFLQKYNVKTIKGHRDFRNNPPGHNRTACPGRYLYNKLPYIRRQINKKKTKKKRRNMELYRKKGEKTVYLKAGKHGYPIKSAKAFNEWFGKDAWNYIKMVKRFPFKVLNFSIDRPHLMAAEWIMRRQSLKELTKSNETMDKRIDVLEKRYKDTLKELKTVRKALTACKAKSDDDLRLGQRIINSIKYILNKLKK